MGWVFITEIRNLRGRKKLHLPYEEYYPTENIHHGHNIKRFREMMGLKKDALAVELGYDGNQQKVSLLEHKETVESDILKQVSAILKVPVEAFENFDEEQALNIIANTVNTVNDNATGQVFQINPTINTSEKWIEALEEIKKIE